MNMEQDSVSDFLVGHGGADALAKPIVASGYVRKAYKGIEIRAASDNSIDIYVGRQNVRVDTGYPLSKGEELLIPIEDPSKVYVVATPVADCVQTVGITGEIPGDTFTLTFRGEPTTPIPVDADDATVLAALEELSTIGPGNCSVTDTEGHEPFEVTFIGDLAKQDVDLMTATGSGVNETQTITITTPGAGDQMVLTYDSVPATAVAYDADSATVEAALQAIPALAGNVSVEDGSPGWIVEFIGTLEKTDVPFTLAGTCGKNEIQTVTLTSPDGTDMLTLAYDGTPATAVAYDSDAAVVEAALQIIPALTGKVSVIAGDPSGWVVEFGDTLARTDVLALTGTCGRNEKQTITLAAPVAGDTVIVTLGAEHTDEFAYTSDAAAVQTALQDITALTGKVSVTGDYTTGWIVEFVDTLEQTNVDPLTATYGQNEKQTVTVPVTVDTGTFTLTYGTESTAIAFNAAEGAVKTALETIAALDGNVEVSDTEGHSPYLIEFDEGLARQSLAPLVSTSSCGQNEVQSITLTSVESGTFTLVYDGSAPVSVDYDEEVADLLTKLETIGALTGNISVGGSAGAWTVEFINALGLGDGAVLLIADGSGLVGSGASVDVVQEVDGVTATVDVSRDSAGSESSATVEETVAGHNSVVTVEVTQESHNATVNVTETQPGDETCAVAIAKVADITVGSKYSWLVC